MAKLLSAAAEPRLALFGMFGVLIFVTGGLLQAAEARRATRVGDTARVACAVPPRTFEDVAGPVEPALANEHAIGPLPEGEAADPEIVAAVTATLAEMAACLTAGQMLRFYALHSDGWLQECAARGEGITTLTTSTVPLDDGERAVYLGPWRVRRLADGRVMAATVPRVGDEPRPDPGRVRVLAFVERDGRWLMDETIRVATVAGWEEPVEAAAVVGAPPGAVFDGWTADRGIPSR